MSVNPSLLLPTFRQRVSLVPSPHPVSLPKADDLPPGTSEAEPDGEVHDAEQEAPLVPLGLRHVARAIVRRGRPNPVGRQASHDVAELSQGKRGEQPGGTAGDCDRQEGRVHGPDMGSSGSKEVVGVEVEGRDQAKRPLPRQAQSADDANDLAGEPGDETKLVQVGRHGDERSEPGQRVPRLVIGQALLPGDDPGDQENGEPGEGRGHGVDADRGPENPERHGDSEGSSSELLVRAHRPKLGELFLGLGRCIRGVFDLGRVEHVEQGRREQKAAQTRDGGR
mmetsp:Transcript_1502/g.4931  ORF Transcript_1502/g.4931 Transcript_1502/m.4931 type:complete len:281 (-) Transcript_1502:946-1788(-)